MLTGLMAHVGPFTVRSGIISAGLIWVGFVITSIAVNNAFQRRKVMLTVIDGGHWLLALVVQGAVLGALN